MSNEIRIYINLFTEDKKLAPWRLKGNKTHQYSRNGFDLSDVKIEDLIEVGSGKLSKHCYVRPIVAVGFPRWQSQRGGLGAASGLLEPLQRTLSVSRKFIGDNVMS